MGIFTKKVLFVLLCFVFVYAGKSVAQTMDDAIMMGKNRFCVGPGYMYGRWNNYWEGTLKRNNLNLGNITSQQVVMMGNYGITNSVNVLFNVPYVFTRASEGTLHTMNGFQDLSLGVKWRPVRKTFGHNQFSVFAVGSVSFPMSDYTADYLPLSIGMSSTNLAGRAVADYKYKNLFVTASGMYIRRSNITINRDAYYTTRLHLTDQVAMPDAASFNFRTGYRSSRLIAEALLTNFTTLGGFDIRRNDMPFPSNRMNSTTAGVNVKYWFKNLPALSVGGGGDYCVAGRNVGQTSSFNANVLYIFDFNRKKS